MVLVDGTMSFSEKRQWEWQGKEGSLSRWILFSLVFLQNIGKIEFKF